MSSSAVRIAFVCTQWDRGFVNTRYNDLSVIMDWNSWRKADCTCLWYVTVQRKEAAYPCYLFIL